MRVGVKRITGRWLCLAALLTGVALCAKAQEETVMAADSTMQAVILSADSAGRANAKASEVKMPFKPNPTKAVILSAICPGLGQIYNRAYWKLPIVYGGFMGCIYAITWNNKNYKDYSTAYFDLVYDAQNNASDPDAWSSSWQAIAKKNGYDPSRFISDSRWQDNIKRSKDYYRRYRDLSIIITVGVYALCMVDAYVEAQLFDFDISPDLSMRVEPVVVPKTAFGDRLYGLNCSIKF